jgi:uncharacterized protein YecE (DUF72 family)
MKFGKLEDISNVDFSLPKEAESNNIVFSSLIKGEATFYVGCTGWGTKEWKGRYYPNKTKAADFLLEYGRQFNTIELNSTHYGTPKPETLQKWYDHTPDDFKFCPKIHKAISHRKTLGTDSDIIENTMDALSIFQDKLGPCFMQLPPYFGSDRMESLEHFFDIFPSEFDLSIELRHPSWFEDEVVMDELQKMAISHNVGLLITDVAGRRDVLHMRVCGDYIMVRFVGNATETTLHPTDYERIDGWVARIQYYVEKGIKNIYFFPHEPDNILAPDLAEYICSRIAEHTIINTRGPKRIDTGQQLNLF